MIEHCETVRWVDLDAMGVLNNSVYLTLFEQARYAYFAPLEVMRGAAFPFVLGSTAVRFEKPVRGGARLTIAARVARLGTKSLDMDYVVRGVQEVHARGTATLVWVDAELRSAPIPAAVRARISRDEGIAEQG
jgi:acyl-CoA thioester hydrolase